MDEFIKWVVENKEWLFSGAGWGLLGVIVSWIGYVVFKRRPSQKIRSGKNSVNIQAGRDIQMKSESKRNNVDEK